MRAATMFMFWISGIALYFLGLFFGLQIWGLAGLVAFAVIPPLELALPFIVWFVADTFPLVLFALWAIQLTAFVGLTAITAAEEGV